MTRTPVEYKGFVKALFAIQHQNPDINIYIVGGFIRDLIGNNKSTDIDIIITGASRNKIKKLFGRKTILFSHKVYDIIYFRVNKEKKADVTFYPDANTFSIEEDCKQRDIMANSLYYDMKAEEIIDPTGIGYHDAKNKIIRPINAETFMEDEKRLFRVLHLMATKNFSFSEEMEALLFKEENIIEWPELSIKKRQTLVKTLLTDSCQNLQKILNIMARLGFYKEENIEPVVTVSEFTKFIEVDFVRNKAIRAILYKKLEKETYEEIVDFFSLDSKTKHPDNFDFLYDTIENNEDIEKICDNNFLLHFFGFVQKEMLIFVLSLMQSGVLNNMHNAIKITRYLTEAVRIFEMNKREQKARVDDFSDLE